MITSPRTLAKVSGLFGYKKVEIASFKEMEDLCKSDYYSKEKKYPDWNFQENHKPYPPELARKRKGIVIYISAKKFASPRPPVRGQRQGTP